MASFIGRELTTFEIGAPSEVRLELALAATAFEVESALRVVPARLSGTILGGDDKPFALAVAINGSIQAVAWIRRAKGPRRAFWSAFVKEESFRAGRNRAEFFVVEGRRGAVRLRPVTATFADS